MCSINIVSFSSSVSYLHQLLKHMCEQNMTTPTTTISMETSAPSSPSSSFSFTNTTSCHTGSHSLTNGSPHLQARSISAERRVAIRDSDSQAVSKPLSPQHGRDGHKAVGSNQNRRSVGERDKFVLRERDGSARPLCYDNEEEDSSSGQHLHRVYDTRSSRKNLEEKKHDTDIRNQIHSHDIERDLSGQRRRERERHSRSPSYKHSHELQQQCTKQQRSRSNNRYAVRVNSSTRSPHRSSHVSGLHQKRSRSSDSNQWERGLPSDQCKRLRCDTHETDGRRRTTSSSKSDSTRDRLDDRSPSPHRSCFHRKQRLREVVSSSSRCGSRSRSEQHRSTHDTKRGDHTPSPSSPTHCHNRTQDRSDTHTQRHVMSNHSPVTPSSLSRRAISPAAKRLFPNTRSSLSAGRRHVPQSANKPSSHEVKENIHCNGEHVSYVTANSSQCDNGVLVKNSLVVSKVSMPQLSGQSETSKISKHEEEEVGEDVSSTEEGEISSSDTE